VATITGAQFNVEFIKVKPLTPDHGAPATPLASRTRISLAAGSNAPVVEQDAP
jgi:alkaline phosphatase D